MNDFKIFRAIPDLCTGCQRCEILCSLKKTGSVNPLNSRIKIRPASHDAACSILMCRHCRIPVCQQACPVPEAMYPDDRTGAFVINDEKCIGCRACVDACPFEAIQIGPEGEILKCDLCGGSPVCVIYCQDRPEKQFSQLRYPKASCLEYVEPHRMTRKC